MSENRIGRYEIVREVGRGGMGVVYEARDSQLGRRVALKVLTVADNLAGEARRNAVERFYREARSAGRISHANIAQVYDCGEDSGRYYIAMEFCQGTTLRDLIHFERRLSDSRTREIGMQLISALEAAHATGIVHRDIKPENIVIGPDNRIKLTDFGIAKVLGDATVTQTGQMLGSPAYMSPEQVMGKPVDARSDLFSAGAVLYECLKGSKAFEGDTITSITHKIAHDEPGPLTGVGGYWIGILAKAMAKDPAQRYQCATDMLMDLRAQRSPLPGAQAAPVQPNQTMYSPAPGQPPAAQTQQTIYQQPPVQQPPVQWQQQQQYPPQYPPPQQPYQYQYPYQMRPTTYYATWGLVLGILSLLVCPLIFGLAGIALSATGMSKGEKLGLTALIVSIVCMVLGFILGMVIMMGHFAKMGM